jgi:pimeloyl-ACP methyl ester carboxylesterase
MPITPPDNSAMYKSVEGYRRCMALYDRMLGQITVPYQTQFVETRFGATHVLRAGESQNPPVFLLHGMNANAITWVPQINELGKRYCIYAADMPASMGKSTPNRIPREGSAYADWLLDTMDGVGAEQASFIGVSFGGWLTIKLATIAPQRMISAALMSSAGFVPQSNKALYKMLPRLLIMPFVPFEQRADLFLQVMGAPGYKATEEDKELFGLLLTYVKHDGRAPEALPDEELKCLACPTALFYGQYEAAFDKERALERARRLLPNLVQSEIVAGVSHGMTGEDVSKVNALLLKFLNAHHHDQHK